jgi:hypothetical protein
MGLAIGVPKHPFDAQNIQQTKKNNKVKQIFFPCIAGKIATKDVLLTDKIPSI